MLEVAAALIFCFWWWV